MIDTIVRKAYVNLRRGYHVQESIDMAIDACVKPDAITPWERGRITNEVYERLANVVRQ